MEKEAHFEAVVCVVMEIKVRIVVDHLKPARHHLLSL